MKTCKGCGETKPKVEFDRHRGNADGCQSRCKVCSSAARRTPAAMAYRREWHKKNRQRPEVRAKLLIYEREYRAARKPSKDAPCLDCGRTFPPEAMDWDHVRGEKLFNLGNSPQRSPEEVAIEVAKCDLVCACCHRIRTQTRITDAYS